MAERRTEMRKRAEEVEDERGRRRRRGLRFKMELEIEKSAWRNEEVEME